MPSNNSSKHEKYRSIHSFMIITNYSIVFLVINFTIIAKEAVSKNPKYSSAPVTVYVRDINDNFPEFTQQQYEVSDWKFKSIIFFKSIWKKEGDSNLSRSQLKNFQDKWLQPTSLIELWRRNLRTISRVTYIYHLRRWKFILFIWIIKLSKKWEVNQRS